MIVFKAFGAGFGIVFGALAGVMASLAAAAAFDDMVRRQSDKKEKL